MLSILFNLFDINHKNLILGKFGLIITILFIKIDLNYCGKCPEPKILNPCICLNKLF